MLIKLDSDAVTTRGHFRAGDTVDLPRADALRLIRAKEGKVLKPRSADNRVPFENRNAMLRPLVIR